MRVEAPSTTSSESVRRKPAASGGSAFKVSSGASEAPRAEAVASTQPLTNLDTLVSLQEVPGDREARKRAVKRAGDMLSMLEAIRFDLLDGLVPMPRLEALVRMVRTQRDHINDPRLSHVLDEIELRARVELAKLGQPCQ